MTKVKVVKLKVHATSRKMAGIGTPLFKIPSGKVIIGVKKKIMDQYKDYPLISNDYLQEYMCNYIEEGGVWGEIPTGWCMSNASCYYCLAALVHHGNPNITNDPTTVEAGEMRTDQHKEMAYDHAKAVAVAKSAVGTVPGKTEESMSVTKAKQMKKNIELQEI
jgi:hypothetical protein